MRKSIVVMFLLLLLGPSANAQTFPGTLNIFTTSNTWTALQTISTPAGLTGGLAMTQIVAGSSAASVSINTVVCGPDTASITGANSVLNCTDIFQGFGGSNVQGARQALLATSQLQSPTSASNVNRNYIAGTFFNSPTSNDGGGVGTEKGSFFGVNPFVLLCATCTNVAGAVGGEVDMIIPTGASVLDKYGWSIVQYSTDAVAGSRNDAASFYGNQSGAVGWGALIQLGNNINQAPLKSTGSIMLAKGTQTVAHGLDFTNITCTTDCLKIPGGIVMIGTPAGTPTGLGVQAADGSELVLFAGTTKGIRFGNNSTQSMIEGVDNTGAGSFQPLFLNGSTLTLQSNGGTTAVAIDAKQHVKFSGGTPTQSASACAGFALTTGSGDAAGRVTFTSATSCAISFGSSYTNAPFCNVTPGTATTPSTVDVTTTTTVLTANFTTAQTSMMYHCFGA